MADTVKRLNYFNGQFLNAQDFTDEQSYHSGLRQAHNRLLHTWGIADGLMLSADKGALQVKVSPGYGIDIHGREIVLAVEGLTDDLTAFGGKSPLYITIAWNEVESDKSTVAGVTTATRMELKPVIKVATDLPATGEALVLGTVTVDAQGRVTDNANDPTLRRMAGAKGGDLSVVSLNVSGLNIAPAMQPRFTVTTAGRLDLQGGLAVTGTLSTTGKTSIGAVAGNQMLEIGANGGLGFAGANLNSSDKKLYSPADGDLEWFTHNAAGRHGFAVSHQGTKAVYLSTSGDSFLNGGNVGIGTATPTSKLHVVGDITATSGSLAADRASPEGGRVSIMNTSKTGAITKDWAIWNMTGTYGNGLSFWRYYADGTNAGPTLWLGDNANVGIGTTAPANKLEVRADGKANNAWAGRLALSNSPADKQVFLGTYNSNAIVGAHNFALTGWAPLYLNAVGVGSGGDVYIPGGNLGIGTVTPQAPLHVTSDIAVGPFGVGRAPGRVSLTGSAAELSFARRDLAAWPATVAAGDRWVWYAGDGNQANFWTEVNGNLLTVTKAGDFTTRGALRAGNSDIYFTNSEHNHTGIGNATGNAAIENAKDYQGLMILGRSGSTFDGGAKRVVRLWDYMQINGDLLVTGRIGAQAGQTNFNQNPRTSGWGGGMHTFDIEVEATAWVRNGVQTGNRDLAEIYFSGAELEAGELVCLDPEADGIIRSREADDAAVIGIISSEPGLLLNSQMHCDPPADGKTGYPVALAGRVPCKVTDENGPIGRGDALTASSTPGYAMRAEPIMVDGKPVLRPGTLVGKALEPHEKGKGVIEVFVTLR